MKLHSILLTLSIATVSITAQHCSSTAAKEHNEQSEKASKSEVVREAFMLSKGQFMSSIKIPGELVAFQRVDLYAKVNSFVQKLFVDVGSEVRTGQLLATLQAPELNAQLLAAESRLKSQEAIYLASKANYLRLVEASKLPGTISTNDLDLALSKQNSDLAQLDAAKATYREINDTRNYLEIRAPFGGVISARNVSTGAYVGPSGKGSDLPLFSLQEQQKLRLVVSVPEAYVRYVPKESQINFTVKALPEQTFHARVTRLAGALDERFRSQRTEMDVVNTQRQLLPGMVTEVSVPLDSHSNTFLVPSSAVLNSTQGVYIIKVESGKGVWVPIKTGRSGEGKTEIFGDVNPGDTLLNNVSEEIRDGAPVGKLKQV